MKTKRIILLALGILLLASLAYYIGYHVQPNHQANRRLINSQSAEQVFYDAASVFEVDDSVLKPSISDPYWHQVRVKESKYAIFPWEYSNQWFLKKGVVEANVGATSTDKQNLQKLDSKLQSKGYAPYGFEQTKLENWFSARLEREVTTRKDIHPEKLSEPYILTAAYRNTNYQLTVELTLKDANQSRANVMLRLEYACKNDLECTR